MPKLGADTQRLDTIPGTVPNPARFPSGCKFHPRCHRTQQLAQSAPPDQVVEISSSGQKLKVLRRCQLDEPVAREIEKQHWAACHQIPGYDSSHVTMMSLLHKREVNANIIESDSRAAGKVIQEAVT